MTLYISPPPHPEQRLLLSVVSASGADFGEALPASLDHAAWRRLGALAERHAVLPLAFKGLCAHAQNVPEDLFADLKRKVQLNVGFSYRLTKLLLELVALFGAHGVRSVPFKGPSLAVSAYGDLTLRSFSDLDIFIHREDVAAASALLEQRGFRRASPDENPAIWGQVDYHEAFVNAADDLVELHWDIAPSFFARSFASAPYGEGFWERTRHLSVLGQPLNCFSPEDQLLLLTIHGGKHLWERLGWICDVAMLLRREVVAWPELWGRARQLGAERMLLLGVGLAHELLEAPVPEEVLRTQVAPYLGVLMQDVVNRLFPRPGVSTMSVPRFYLSLQARPADRLRLALHLLRGKLS